MNYCDFGIVLKELRKSRSLTQAELGAAIGLSKAVISKYENGMGYPNFDVLIHIARFFGVTTDYMLGVDQSKTINVSDLSNSQIDVLHHLIAEFKNTQKNNHRK